jgi:uncharacterized repeat protein (TIGR03803 family)
MFRAKSLQLPCRCVCACLMLSAALCAAQTEIILHQFQQTSSKDGSAPYSGLIADAQGRLYGNTTFGGTSGNGVVFEMLPPSSGTGSWRYKILHNFGATADGAGPRGNMLLDQQGNLYGTTQAGGQFGCGTVYELSPSSSGTWTETFLYSFLCNGSDAAGPTAGVVFDDTGNLYGTTVNGGRDLFGAVFRLTPNGRGLWTESVLHSFTSTPDGANPFGALAFAGHNTFYGFTPYGGTNGSGTLFAISATGEEKVLYSFQDEQDGGYPQGTPILDSFGNIYGGNNTGGSTDNGVVFEFTPPAGGSGWTETVLNDFTGTDGANCLGVVFGADGVLYGSTWTGGSDGNGTVFQLTPPSSGSGLWTETVLHSFTGSPDGANVWAPPVVVNDVLYGVTHDGGVTGAGIVFEVTP